MSKIAKALDKAAKNRREYSHDSEEHGNNARSPIYTTTTVSNTLNSELRDSGRLLGDDAESQLLNTINLLRTQILKKTRRANWTTIMVTSPNPGTGKTTIAINLAMSIARELQHTALLVDLHLRHSSITNRLGLGELPGLSEHLTEGVPIETLLVNPGVEKLVVLPAGSSLDNSAELLGASRMRQLVDELKYRYSDRYIIFDAPHIVGLSDAIICSEYMDAILLVIGDGETKTGELQMTLELLSGSNIIGLVLNKVR